MDTKKISQFVNGRWDDSIIPELCEYIKIPNKSPAFDADWEKHGYMEDAVALMEKWVRAQPIKGMEVEVLRLEGRTPLIFCDIPGDSDDVVLLYGHLDKQPETTGWKDGLEPWKPVIRDGKLYGRGGADDGYAVFGSLTAIRALQEQGIPHAHCKVIIEGCEESGSFDLPYYIDVLRPRLGQPSLVVCLDAECGNYDQLWCTTSLRGNLIATLSVDVLTESVHSGASSGICASSFRVLRSLLDRVEDSETGRILVDELHADIPQQRIEQTRKAIGVLGDMVHRKLPFFGNTQPIADDLVELMLNNTWRPTLSITGMDRIPSVADAGNVLRQGTTVKVSFRLPPTVDAKVAGDALTRILEADPPYGATVSFSIDSAESGWNAPEVAEWLENSMQTASKAFFDNDSMYMGTGGTIPFMSMLGKEFSGD
ncbi:MAG: M20/M25/M40 family metallo-hydrolase [Proteobacteria bacterium]|nr:M20/M25/M40 family metallo-hydrolase [Pseudomonadota bacterium]